MDYQQAVLDAYEEKNFLKCLTLIDDCPVEKARDSPHYKVLKAICLSNLGIEFKKAHRILDELLDEKNDMAVYAKAMAFFNEKDYDSSIEFFQKAFNLDPEKLAVAKEMRKKAEQLKNQAEGKVLEEQMEITFNCERCQETFKNSTDFSQHMLKHSSSTEKPDLEGQVEGDRIEEDAKEEAKVEDPVEVINEPVNTSFPHEPFPTFDPNISKSPQKVDTDRPHKCRHCSKKFKLEKTLNYHEKLHRKDVFLSCDYCGQKFENKDSLMIHIKGHKVKQFGCNLCLLTYSSIKYLGDHFRSVHLKKK